MGSRESPVIHFFKKIERFGTAPGAKLKLLLASLPGWFPSSLEGRVSAALNPGRSLACHRGWGGRPATESCKKTDQFRCSRGFKEGTTVRVFRVRGSEKGGRNSERLASEGNHYYRKAGKNQTRN